jgi:hypothetical protein
MSRASARASEPHTLHADEPHGWYRVFYAVCTVAMSALTMRDAASLRDHHAWLAALEIVSVALLLLRRTRYVGLVLLLAVFGIAALLTAHAGRSPLALVLFAGSAVLVTQLGAESRRPR